MTHYHLSPGHDPCLPLFAMPFYNAEKIFHILRPQLTKFLGNCFYGGFCG